MNKPKPSLKESFGKAQDKCKCHRCHCTTIGPDCECGYEIFSCSHCSKKSVVNKRKLVVNQLSSKSPSVSRWEDEIFRIFIRYSISTYNKLSEPKIKPYAKEVNEIIFSLLLKQKKELEEEYKEGVNYGMWKEKEEWREKMKSLKNKYVGKGNVYENEAYHKILEELVESDSMKG